MTKRTTNGGGAIGTHRGQRSQRSRTIHFEILILKSQHVTEEKVPDVGNPDVFVFF